MQMCKYTTYIILFLQIPPLLLLLVRLHDQSSISDEVGGLLQVLQAPIVSDEAELLMATVRFALVGVCHISEEHARLSGPPHHRDTLGKERFLGFLYMCAPQTRVYTLTHEVTTLCTL